MKNYLIIILALAALAGCKQETTSKKITGYIVYKQWIKGHSEHVDAQIVNEANMLSIPTAIIPEVSVTRVSEPTAEGGAHMSPAAVHESAINEHASYAAEEHVTASGYRYNTEFDENHFIYCNPSISVYQRAVVYSHVDANKHSISSMFLIWVANKDDHEKIEVDSVYWFSHKSGDKVCIPVEKK